MISLSRAQVAQAPVSYLAMMLLLLASVFMAAGLARGQLAGLAAGNNDNAELYQLVADDAAGAPDGNSMLRGAEPAMTYTIVRGPDGEISFEDPQRSQALYEEHLVDSLADELLEERLEQQKEQHSRSLPVNMWQDQEDHLLQMDVAEKRHRDTEPLSGHWPAHGLDQQDGSDGQESRAYSSLEVSQPVNDPEEFEARLGRLTDALNQQMPNTLHRQALLMGLMNQSSLDFDESSSSSSSLAPDSRARVLAELGQLAAMRGEDQDQEEDREQQQQQRAEESSSSQGSEYIDRPLELSGHQYVQGGAGEGRQLLGPEGTYENVQVVKSDTGIPSYCDPPNPCPIGYTARDGCLEEFVNLASFSREYQAKQQCSCDNEHSLFNCASPLQSTPPAITTSTTRESNNELSDGGDEDEERKEEKAEKLSALQRTIESRLGSLASVQRLISKQEATNEQQQQQQQVQEVLGLAGHDDENSDYLVRSARKLSSLDMHHKVELD